MRQWLQITSGRGPEECCRIVAMVAGQILDEAARFGLQAEIIDEVPAERDGDYKSILLALEGDTVAQFVSTWAGTVQWTGRSPYRPHHKRKNWFVGVSALQPVAVTDWTPSEVRFETMRASGPGGQHVNKTESAVRAIHLPTGLSTIAREERSQYQNRRLALARLIQTLRQRDQAHSDQARRDLWDQHNILERGNPVRKLVGMKMS